jgi:hypothetical protein
LERIRELSRARGIITCSLLKKIINRLMSKSPSSMMSSTYMLKSQRTANYVTNSKVWSETLIKNKRGNACITKH